MRWDWRVLGGAEGEVRGLADKTLSVILSGVEVLLCEAKRNTVKPKHNGSPLCEEIYKRLWIPDLHKLLFLVHEEKRM